MSDTTWHSYPKIKALGPKHFTVTDTTVFEEKVDGSQFSFGMIDGELRMRSRKIQLHEVEV